VTRTLRVGFVSRRGGQQGYILLTLCLFAAALAIAVAVVAPTMAFQMKREREAELLHRGVQYSRAIRTFTKKTGRYPMRLEDLRGNNEIRYIRKLYKDPLTGREFRLVRMADIQAGGAASNVNVHHDATGDASGASDSANTPSGTDPDANSGNPTSPTTQQTGAAPGAASNGGFSSATTGNGSGTPVGEAFIGVASTSKLKTVREFDRKNHYRDWLFFYNPAYDRGYEITGPTSLSAPVQALQGQTAGATGQPPQTPQQTQ
jgi:type II secretory pathway pseudopilin PulG